MLGFLWFAANSAVGTFPGVLAELECVVETYFGWEGAFFGQHPCIQGRKLAPSRGQYMAPTQKMLLPSRDALLWELSRRL